MESSSHIEKTNILAMSVEENYRIQVTLFDKKFGACSLDDVKKIMQKAECTASPFPLLTAPARLLRQISEGVSEMILNVN